jgi:hypothetical protein
MEKPDPAHGVSTAMFVTKHLPGSALMSLGRKNRHGLNFG